MKECSKCNISIVGEVDHSLKKITKTQLYYFLCSFDKSCSSNIEYSEYSNEILFKVLLNYPAEVIEVLSGNPNFDLNYIYEEISFPLVNCDLDMLYKKIENSKGDEEVKQDILKALENAKSDR